MTIYLTNAFSINMISPPTTVKFTIISTEEVRELISGGFISAVGHEATARLLSQVLGIDIPMNRIEIKVGANDVVVVAQLMLPRELLTRKDLSIEELMKYKDTLKFVRVEVVQ